MRTGPVVTVLLFLGLAVSGCLGGSPSKAEDPVATPGPTGSAGTNGTLTVDFTFTPLSPATNESVHFQDLSVDTTRIVDRAWDFGDGHGSTSRNPVHSFATAGVYRVTLRAQNEADAEATAHRFVPVHAAIDGGDAPPPGVPTAYIEFGEPVTVTTQDGGEPTIAADSEGRIFVNTIGSLFRSTDGGKTFQGIDYPGFSGLSGDSHVVVDTDDRLWVSDLGGYTPPGISVSAWSSTDHGDSWDHGNPLASDTVTNDRQWLAATSGGTAYLLFRHCAATLVIACVDYADTTAVSRITKTTDGGDTWLPLTRSFRWNAFPFVDPNDGTLYVVHADTNDRTIDVAVSDNGGASFDRQVRVDTRETDPTVLFVNGAVDDAGNAYVAWVDKDEGQFDVWLAYSTDQGRKWSTPVRVSSGVGTNVFPWITAGADGRVVVVWYGTDEVASTPDEAPDEAAWYVHAAYSSTAHDEEPVFSQARATGIIHRGPICTQGLGCDVGGDEDADRDLLDFLTVVILPDGRAAIAYAEDGSGEQTRARVVVQTGGPLGR